MSVGAFLFQGTRHKPQLKPKKEENSRRIGENENKNKIKEREDELKK